MELPEERKSSSQSCNSFVSMLLTNSMNSKLPPARYFSSLTPSALQPLDIIYKPHHHHYSYTSSPASQYERPSDPVISECFPASKDDSLNLKYPTSNMQFSSAGGVNKPDFLENYALVNNEFMSSSKLRRISKHVDSLSHSQLMNDKSADSLMFLDSSSGTDFPAHQSFPDENRLSPHQLLDKSVDVVEEDKSFSHPTRSPHHSKVELAYHSSQLVDVEPRNAAKVSGHPHFARSNVEDEYDEVASLCYPEHPAKKSDSFREFQLPIDKSELKELRNTPLTYSSSNNSQLDGARHALAFGGSMLPADALFSNPVDFSGNHEGSLEMLEMTYDSKLMHSGITSDSGVEDSQGVVMLPVFPSRVPQVQKNPKEAFRPSKVNIPGSRPDLPANGHSLHGRGEEESHLFGGARIVQRPPGYSKRLSEEDFSSLVDDGAAKVAQEIPKGVAVQPASQQHQYDMRIADSEAEGQSRYFAQSGIDKRRGSNASSSPMIDEDYLVSQQFNRLNHKWADKRSPTGISASGIHGETSRMAGSFETHGRSRESDHPEGAFDSTLPNSLGQHRDFPHDPSQHGKPTPPMKEPFTPPSRKMMTNRMGIRDETSSSMAEGRMLFDCSNAESSSSNSGFFSDAAYHAVPQAKLPEDSIRISEAPRSFAAGGTRIVPISDGFSTDSVSSKPTAAAAAGQTRNFAGGSGPTIMQGQRLIADDSPNAEKLAERYLNQMYDKSSTTIDSRSPWTAGQRGIAEKFGLAGLANDRASSDSIRHCDFSARREGANVMDPANINLPINQTGDGHTKNSHLLKATGRSSSLFPGSMPAKSTPQHPVGISKSSLYNNACRSQAINQVQLNPDSTGGYSIDCDEYSDDNYSLRVNSTTRQPISLDSYTDDDVGTFPPPHSADSQGYGPWQSANDESFYVVDNVWRSRKDGVDHMGGAVPVAGGVHSVPRGVSHGEPSQTSAAAVHKFSADNIQSGLAAFLNNVKYGTSDRLQNTPSISEKINSAFFENEKSRNPVPAFPSGTACRPAGAAASSPKRRNMTENSSDGSRAGRQGSVAERRGPGASSRIPTLTGRRMEAQQHYRTDLPAGKRNLIHRNLQASTKTYNPLVREGSNSHEAGFDVHTTKQGGKFTGENGAFMHAQPRGGRVASNSSNYENRQAVENLQKNAADTSSCELYEGASNFGRLGSFARRIFSRPVDSKSTSHTSFSSDEREGEAKSFEESAPLGKRPPFSARKNTKPVEFGSAKGEEPPAKQGWLPGWYFYFGLVFSWFWFMMSSVFVYFYKFRIINLSYFEMGYKKDKKHEENISTSKGGENNSQAVLRNRGHNWFNPVYVLAKIFGHLVFFRKAAVGERKNIDSEKASSKYNCSRILSIIVIVASVGYISLKILESCLFLLDRNFELDIK